MNRVVSAVVGLALTWTSMLQAPAFGDRPPMESSLDVA
jgi:hypothetical protein